MSKLGQTFTLQLLSHWQLVEWRWIRSRDFSDYPRAIFSSFDEWLQIQSTRVGFVYGDEDEFICFYFPLYLSYFVKVLIHNFCHIFRSWWYWIRRREKPSSYYPQSQSLLFRLDHSGSTPFKETSGFFVRLLLSWCMTIIGFVWWWWKWVLLRTSIFLLYSPWLRVDLYLFIASFFCSFSTSLLKLY